MHWVLAGYIWLFVHRPFEIWPWFSDIHIERMYMLFTLGYWATVAPKSWTSNRLNVGFLALAGAVLLAAVLTPLPEASGLDSVGVQNWLKIAVFYVLVLSSVRTEHELRVIVGAFVVVFGLYLVHSLREYSLGRYAYNMGTVRMVGVDQQFRDANTFGNSIVYALPMVLPLWTIATRNQRWALAGFVGLCGLCVLLTGSRSSFVGMCAVGALAVLRAKHRVAILAVTTGLACVAFLSLREDLQKRYLTIIDPSEGPSNAKASADFRDQAFYDGVKLWGEYPISGVGPGAFGVALGHGMAPHNLYGQILGELGTIGALAFIAVVFGFVGNAWEAHRLTRNFPELRTEFTYKISVAAIATVALMMLLGLGAHNLLRYTWLWYGAFQAISLRLLREKVDKLADERDDEVETLDTEGYDEVVPLARSGV